MTERVFGRKGSTGAERVRPARVLPTPAVPGNDEPRLSDPCREAPKWPQRFVAPGHEDSPLLVNLALGRRLELRQDGRISTLVIGIVFAELFAVTIFVVGYLRGRGTWMTDLFTGVALIIAVVAPIGMFDSFRRARAHVLQQNANTSVSEANNFAASFRFHGVLKDAMCALVVAWLLAAACYAASKYLGVHHRIVSGYQLVFVYEPRLLVFATWAFALGGVVLAYMKLIGVQLMTPQQMAFRRAFGMQLVALACCDLTMWLPPPISGVTALVALTLIFGGPVYTYARYDDTTVTPAMRPAFRRAGISLLFAIVCFNIKYLILTDANWLLGEPTWPQDMLSIATIAGALVGPMLAFPPYRWRHK